MLTCESLRWMFVEMLPRGSRFCLGTPAWEPLPGNPCLGTRSMAGRRLQSVSWGTGASLGVHSQAGVGGDAWM
ncbi:hypothetical protein Q31b_49830 [Novipirellula aureliae]|uniref:Uncharacterized protein n=1 Tax=Novipirellula aureliae TaxID=2527966 RepID=A0A5C6DM27_9BACT|nr:hypothetical protein Q31b_49830 [Novipirellula aureliae]